MPGEKKADNDDVFQTMGSGTFPKVLRERGKKGSGITRQRREGKKHGNNRIHPTDLGFCRAAIK